MKVFNLIPGKLSIELPADWQYGDKIPLYEDSIYQGYIGKKDTSSIYIDIRKVGLYNNTQLRYSLKDRMRVFADSLLVLNEKTIFLNKDTTFIILYSYKVEKTRYYGGVAYNAEFSTPMPDTLNHKNMARFLFVHDMQKNQQEVEALCDNIFSSIRIIK